MPTPTRRFDAVVCDIDGCLAPESSAPFDVGPLAAISAHNRLAQDRLDRPVLTLCSGRPQPFAEAVCRLVGNATLPCVCENGVWLYHPRDNRYERDPTITREHLRAVREAEAWVESALGPRGVSVQPGKCASVSLYHPDTALLRSFVPGIEARFASEGWPFRVSMTWLYINCDLAHVSKATGMDRLLRDAGLVRERVAGIGDTPGDAGIADRCAWFACPANADPRIASRADYVASRAEAAGVAEILGRLPGSPT